MAANPDLPAPQDAPKPLVSPPITGRANPNADRPLLPPALEEQFAQLLQSVQILSAHFIPEREEPEESLREPNARRVRKFQRVGSDEPAPADPGVGTGDAPATTEASDALAVNKNVAWPRKPATAQVPPRLAPQWWQKHPLLGWWLGAQALGMVLLVIGYLLGHGNNRSAGGRGAGYGRPGSDLFGQPELTEQALRTANAALHAEHSGDSDGARKIYEEALGKHVALAGINYRLALLAIGRNDRLEAEQRLERSVEDGEYVADCCYVLSRLAADKGDLEEASNQLEKAARSRPLEGKYFFYWGEALRRQGKPQAAVTAFDQALDRPYTAANGDLYLFKQRLARLEFGHDDQFNAELAAHLKQPPVAGEWLLLAAAQALDRQAYTTAADALRQASDRLPSAWYSDLTHDYVFQAQAKRPEVSEWLNHPPAVSISSAGLTVLDPGSWTVERGDPGTWPPPHG